MTVGAALKMLEACRTKESGLVHIERQIENLMRRRALFCRDDPNNAKINCEEKSCLKLCEKIDNLRDKLRHESSESFGVKERCEKILELIPDEDDREILCLYYIDGMTWHQIAAAIHYSLSHVMKHRRAALAVLTAALGGKEGGKSSEDRD